MGDEEEPNQEGIRYYTDVVDELLAHGIEPIVTLYHFEMPYHLVTGYGSWTNRKLIGFYLKYLSLIHISLIYWVFSFFNARSFARCSLFMFISPASHWPAVQPR